MGGARCRGVGGGVALGRALGAWLRRDRGGAGGGVLVQSRLVPAETRVCLEPVTDSLSSLSCLSRSATLGFPNSGSLSPLYHLLTTLIPYHPVVRNPVLRSRVVFMRWSGGCLWCLACLRWKKSGSCRSDPSKRP